MSWPNCIITGVTLYSEDGDWCKPADLFIFGDRFIVNASGNGEQAPVSPSSRVLSFSEATPYFERRNVYIFPADKALLNPAALKYIQESPHVPPTLP